MPKTASEHDCEQALYDVKLKTAFFAKFFPDINTDVYEEAFKDPVLLQQLIDSVIGKQVQCKAFIFRNGSKSSITLHPAGNR